jgi:hypothetical protein
MRSTGSIFLGLLFGFAFLFIPVQGICSDEMPIPYPNVPRISAKRCLTLEKEASPPVIIDVRPDVQYKESLDKLPGAVREDPENVQSWAHKYKKDQTLILY